MLYLPQRSRSLGLSVALVVALLSSCSPGAVRESPRPPAAQQPNARAAADVTPAASRIQARIGLPSGTRSVTFGDRSIWISNPAERSVSRLDSRTGEVVRSPIALDFEPWEIMYGAQALWVCSADRTRLVRIDPRTHTVVATIDLRALSLPTTDRLLLAADKRTLWLTTQTTVFQIDPGTNRIVGQPLQVGEEIIAAAVGHGSLWTGSHDDGIVARIDSTTRRVVTTIDVGFAVHGLAVSEESAWVLDEHGFAVVRIDPQSNRLGERIPIDFVAANLTAGSRSVWVAPAARDSGQATGNDGVLRIGEAEQRAVETIHVGEAATSQYYALFSAEGAAWVWIDAPEQTLVQIAP
ncbi:MAG TPA: hypothetical protein VGD69_23315 [Herpetosiphonaceae bacterium]